MKVILGHVFNRVDVPPLIWDPDSTQSINPHLLISGSSGSGKTTLIKYLVSKQAQGDNEQKGKHIYIFDLKGDMLIKDDKGEKIGNYIELTSWGSAYGINPFEFDTGLPRDVLQDVINNKHEVTDDELSILKNSGPKIQVERLVEIIKKNFLPNMSTQQNGVFSKLFNDTYKAKGIIYNDYKTWLNPLPSFNDTLELINRIENTVNDKDSLNFDKETVDFIKNIHEKIYSFQDSLEDEPSKELMTELKSQLDTSFSSYLEFCMKTYERKESMLNNEWLKMKNIDIKKDYLEDDTIKIMMKISSYIKIFQKISVFHDRQLPVKAGLNVINISGLEVSTQKFIVDILLGKIFTACKVRGDYTKRKNKTRGEKCDTIVVIDESKLVVGNARQKNDPYSYLNRIATESRGYGLGLLVASQSAVHFPVDFMKNFDSQILLNTTIADLEVTKKSFSVPAELLTFTQKQYGNALIKVKASFVKAKLSLPNISE